MPHALAIADRIHLARLGRRAAVLNPNKIGISDSVAVMTGAIKPEDILWFVWGTDPQRLEPRPCSRASTRC